MTRERKARFQSRADAEQVRGIQDIANGYPQTGAPTHIGAVWVARGVTNDWATTAKNPDGTALAWTHHHRDVETVYDLSDPENPVPTGDHDLDLASLAEPTPEEIPDPTARAQEVAAVQARLNSLTAQERGIVQSALAQGGGGGAANLASKRRP